MSDASLGLAWDGDAAILTFNRPDKRNALSPQMVDEFLAALDQLEREPARSVILTGAGKAFCAGMDLGELKKFAAQSRQNRATQAEPSNPAIARPSDADLADARRTALLFRRIYSFPKPLIAAVNGSAIAGGCGLATLCDFTLAAHEARFGYTEVRVGFMPAIVAVFLVRQVGDKRVRDLLLSGRVFSAEEARSLGLVNEVVPGEKLMDRARELARQLAELSPTGIAFTKRLLIEFSRQELDRDLELAVQESVRIRATPDFGEGLAAFLEKRKPIWITP